MNAYSVARHDMSLSNASEHYLTDSPDYTAQPKRRGAGLFAPFVAAFRWIATIHRQAVVLRELSMLSDRELADIGLTRSDLPKVFDAPALSQRNGEYGRTL
jgi:uncharacterized protein YjiS (DUF1127 family)